MNNKTDAMIAKVKAIMDRAKGAGEAERNVALAKAQQLMAKYQIEESQLVDHNNGDDFIRERSAITFANGGPKTRRLIDLCGSIAHAMGVYMTYNSKRGYGAIHLYGRRSSVEAVKLLYTSLSADALTQAAKLKCQVASSLDEWRDSDDRDLLHPSSGKGDRRRETQAMRMGFLEGYDMSIAVRMRENKNKINDESDGTYLPMLMSDMERAKSLVQGKVRYRNNSYGQGSNSGYSAGRAAGNRASLGGTSMPSAPKALTS